MKWAMNYPEFFNAAAGMSGVGDVEEMGFFDVQDGPAVAIFNSFGTKETYRGSRNDLKFLAMKLADGEAYMPRFFSCCGTEDPYYKGTVLFKQFADEIGFPITYETGPGAHEWDFWDRWLRRIIDWMGIKDESK
jgi:S-formylglutathione hydrolase FrmB